MRNRILALQDRLSASYWFIPTIMAILAAILSILTIELDKTVGRNLAWVVGLVYVDSPEGARAVLSTVASSMITVAGVVFSLTMVVLSLTSQQYGPLVLGHFMRDRANQFVLGIFTSTFIYCLMVLRTTRGFESSIFVPHISVLFGLALSIASLALLIFFIHHVSESIQSTHIISSISDDLMAAIENLFPEKMGQEAPTDVETTHRPLLDRLEREGYIVASRKSGYLQLIDENRLLDIARKRNILIDLELRPGMFALRGQPLARVLPLERGSDDLSELIQTAFIFGDRRTQIQDIEFSFTQLSTIGVRALSAAINDPYTAMMCIDRLSEALCSLLARQLPSPYRCDEDGRLRVIVHPITFFGLFHTAFDQIRHYGHSDVQVNAHLLKMIQTLASCTEDPACDGFLRDYADLVRRESQVYLASRDDQKELDSVYREVVRELEAEQPGASGGSAG